MRKKHITHLSNITHVRHLKLAITLIDNGFNLGIYSYDQTFRCFKIALLKRVCWDFNSTL